MLGAVIFDFDGVIADDERLHLEGFRIALSAHGISVSEADYFVRYVGMDDHDGFAAMLADAGHEAEEGEVARLMERKKEAFYELVKQRVRIFPGVRPLLADLRQSPVLPTAIASGALASEITLILGIAGLRDCFDEIVSSDDVSRGKPDPQGFSLACSRLAARRPGLDAGSCVAIEDSLGGLEAARRAGMITVAVTNTHAAPDLEADLVVDSLEELSRARLESLAGA